MAQKAGLQAKILLIGILLIVASLAFDVVMQTGEVEVEASRISFDAASQEFIARPLKPGEHHRLVRGEVVNVLQFDVKNPKFPGPTYLQLTVVSGVADVWHNESVTRFGADGESCKTRGDVFDCRLLLGQINADTTRIVLSAASPFVEIRDVKVTSIAQHHSAWKTSMPLLLLLVIFVPAAIAIGFVADRSTRQRFILLLSTLMLLLLSISLALLIFAFLCTSYLALIGVARGMAPLRMYFLAMLSLLVAVKVVWPATGSYLDISAALILLPVGLSYLLARHFDLAAKIAASQTELPTFFQFCTFSIFWPSFAAGPITEITRFDTSGSDFATWSDRSPGLARVARGLAKKSVADAVFLLLVTRHYSEIMVWGDADPGLVILFFFGNMIFVYLDFSGYTDIALGSGRLMGVRLPENFNNPLFRSNLRSFWQSWHISLTQWVNRMVFIPLSMLVRRQPVAISYLIPVLATTLTIGLWHGLQFVWILWGIHHAIGIILTDYFLKFTASIELDGSKIGGKILRATQKITGTIFVWFWLMLSYSFTLSTNLEISVRNYISLFSAPLRIFF